MARILLAAHDDVMRCYLVRALSRQGHAVMAVADAHEAFGDLLPGAFDIPDRRYGFAGYWRAGTGTPRRRRDSRSKDPVPPRFLSLRPLKEGALPRLEDEALEPPFHLNRLADEIDNLLAA